MKPQDAYHNAETKLVDAQNIVAKVGIVANLEKLLRDAGEGMEGAYTTLVSLCISKVQPSKTIVKVPLPVK